MEKKESFLNLMQEQKQICEKCYLWDNDGCYCASDGRNTKVCEFFNHIDALYSDPPSPESKRDYGLCSSCQFQASAGDYGTIKDCDNTSEELPDYAVKYGDLLGEDEKHQCPIWKPIAPYYCKEHHKWTDGIWAGSCDECLKRIAEETNEQK